MNRFSKRRLVATGLGFVLLGLLYLVWSYSIVEISSQGEFSYKLVKVSEDTELVEGTADKSVRKLVKRGAYDVLVKQGEETYFKAFIANGFLAKTSIVAMTHPGQKHQIIADNPAPCMTSVGGQFISYPCTGPYSSLQVHKRATKENPGYINTPFTKESGVIEDIVNVGDKAYALIHNRGEAVAVPHQIFSLDRSGRLIGGVVLGELSPDKTFRLAPYGDGYIAYSQDYVDYYFFDKAFKNSQKIESPMPKNKTLEPYWFSAHGNQLLYAFSGDNHQEDVNLDDPASGGGSELVLVNDDQTRHLHLSNTYSRLSLCGEGFLCGIVGDRLDVFRLDGEKASLMYSISSTKYVEQLGSNMVVVRKDQTLLLDPATGEGYVHYDYGGAQFCGVQKPATNYYDLCLGANDGARYALRVYLDEPAGFRIDDLRRKLVQQDFIRSVSINYNVIYVNADLGERVFVESIGGFGYDPKIKKVVAEQIDQVIRELNVPKDYVIVNTAN